MAGPLVNLQVFLGRAAVGALVSPEVDGPLAAEIPGVEAELRGTFSVATDEARGVVSAALWLRAGDLDRAHRICQDIATPLGSAWHAVMHRREGDFWNSKYWWRRAQGLAWPSAMAREVGALLAGKSSASALESAAGAGRYDPGAFVDAVEAAGSDAAWISTLQAIQELEWRALFDLSMATLP